MDYKNVIHKRLSCTKIRTTKTELSQCYKFLNPRMETILKEVSRDNKGTEMILLFEYKGQKHIDLPVWECTSIVKQGLDVELLCPIILHYNGNKWVKTFKEFVNEERCKEYIYNYTTDNICLIPKSEWVTICVPDPEVLDFTDPSQSGVSNLYIISY
tara:strand:+ start:488 stop:958 length:471 start_codon:yes stop_codon:yes gene_type:complete